MTAKDAKDAKKKAGNALCFALFVSFAVKKLTQNFSADEAVIQSAVPLQNKPAITPAIKQVAVSFLLVILFVPNKEIRIKNKITIRNMLPLVLLPD